MSKKFLFKLVVASMLSISLVVTPIVDFIGFSEPAAAAAKKSRKKRAKSSKSQNNQKKANSNNKVTHYVCTKCGDIWLKGITSGIDFWTKISTCKSGGTHNWRRYR